MSWDFFLAKKYLTAPTKRGVKVVLRLAVLGVALGVATLTLTQAVLGGFEKVFRESILGFNAHLVVMKDGEMSDPETESNLIFQALRGEYREGTPFLYREALIVAHGRVKGAVFKGIDPLTFSRVYAVKVRPLTGPQVPAKIEDLLQVPGDFPTVVLGTDLAEELGVVGPDETIKVFLPKKSSGGRGERNFQTFKVTGTFSTGLYEFDRGFAFVDIGRLQGLVGAPGTATGIEMLLQHPMQAEAMAPGLQAQLGPGYEAVSWEKLNGPLFSALKKERRVFLVIMAMVVVVAAFNIVGVLLLLIFDKAREISLLRALGARSGALKRVFGYQGFVIGILGSGFGVALGGGIYWLVQKTGILRLEKEVYLVERLPVEWSPLMILTVVGISLGIVLLATLVGVTRVNKTPLDL